MAPSPPLQSKPIIWCCSKQDVVEKKKKLAKVVMYCAPRHAVLPQEASAVEEAASAGAVGCGAAGQHFASDSFCNS